MQSFVRAAALLFGCILASFAAEPQPIRGGILRVAQRAEPKTLNPLVAIDAPSREVLRRLHADLITIDRQSQKSVPALVETYSQSADGRVYTLTLREGVRFSDGHPFTSDDVVFTFGLYLDESIASPQRDLLIIHGRPIEVRRKNVRTVEIRLSEPYAAAERLFDSLPILPRHKLEKPWREGRIRDVLGLHTPASEVVGLGPFRLREYRPGEIVVLERNPYYWRKDKQGGALPYLDGIEFRFLADEDTQTARFLAGDLDVLNRVNPKAAPALRSAQSTVVDVGPSLEYNFLCFNLSPGSARLSWFSKKEFRAAVSLATDRQAMARVVFDGKADAITGHVTPGNRLWYSPTVAKPSPDLESSRLLLRSAGFRYGKDGLLFDEQGRAVEFSILVSTSSAERQRMATMLQADLKAVGIAVTIVPLELRSVIDRVTRSREFDTCLLGFGGGDGDPNSEMNVWLSSGGMHLWNPSQKTPATAWEQEIDELMKRQMFTTSFPARQKLYGRVQQIVATELPMVFLLSPHVLVAQSGAVGNFRPAILDHQTLWNCDELYFRSGGKARP